MPRRTRPLPPSPPLGERAGVRGNKALGNPEATLRSQDACKVQRFTDAFPSLLNQLPP
jgi:hypothetical protein